MTEKLKKKSTENKIKKKGPNLEYLPISVIWLLYAFGASLERIVLTPSVETLNLTEVLNMTNWASNISKQQLLKVISMQ